MKRSSHILKDYNLRQTDCRNEILDVFLDKGFALSHGDVEEKISEEFDRVTVYRTLKTFVERGIIHKVLDDSGSIKYALCNDHCTTDQHHHEHVHFKCVNCGQTNCIEDIEVPQINLPKGYTSLETNLLIQGICEKCS
ncbi:MAG TPA: transcriptional repressor [Cytophagales bacterium]|nr:transcriptional repressor [Cytophagales bacterium]